MKTILVLGAGLVTRPHVRYLLEVPDFEVVVASRTASKAEALIGGHDRGRAVAVNVNNDAELEALVARADLAVSMLPYAYHPKVASLCVKHRANMVTTSYVKDAMRALDGPAQEAGIILLNEIGVDPGIDHMSAMKVIHQVQSKGGRIASFVSWVGGLPAPEASDNPFGYKFSWSPMGVLLAGRNPARFQKDGRVVEIPGDELFENNWPVHINGLGVFEGYPNRDSMPYADTYGIQPDEWMFRGTLRNAGWCATMRLIAAMGWLDDSPWPHMPPTYQELTAQLLDAQAQTDLQRVVAQRWRLDLDAKPITDLEWLGLFSGDPLPPGKTSPIDVLAERMQSKMAYRPGERDMIVMQHQFTAQYPDSREAITATMIDYGIPNGDTSMSRTVGLPAAIAVKMILQGQFAGLTGVQIPVIPEIYNPVLDELAAMDIGLTETVERIG